MKLHLGVIELMEKTANLKCIQRKIQIDYLQRNNIR